MIELCVTELIKKLAGVLGAFDHPHRGGSIWKKAGDRAGVCL